MSIEERKIISFTVYGSPQSKANSRKMVTVRGKPMFIKSKAARDYQALFLKQCPTVKDIYEGYVKVVIDIWYSSNRPDLDESLILDCMQGRVYLNDRQIKKKDVTWHYPDKENPKSVISVYTYEPES